MLVYKQFAKSDMESSIIRFLQIPPANSHKPNPKSYLHMPIQDTLPQSSHNPLQQATPKEPDL